MPTLVIMPRLPSPCSSSCSSCSLTHKVSTSRRSHPKLAFSTFCNQYSSPFSGAHCHSAVSRFLVYQRFQIFVCLFVCKFAAALCVSVSRVCFCQSVSVIQCCRAQCFCLRLCFLTAGARRIQLQPAPRCAAARK